MNRRKLARTVLVGLGCWSLTAVPAAGATSGSVAHCRWSGGITVKPGLTAFESHAAELSVEQGRPIECTGEVNGHSITGPGSYDDEAPTISGSCAEGSGTSTMVLALPTDAGAQHLRIPYSYKYGPEPASGFKSSGPFNGPIPADFDTAMLTGFFAIYPTAGDCVLTPVTQASGVEELVLRT